MNLSRWGWVVAVGSATTDFDLVELFGWISEEDASSALLTLAQVNATIIAFVLGLRIVAIQLSAQYVSKVRFGVGELLFLGAYALIGVVGPVVFSLQPTGVLAAASIIAACIIGAAVPWVLVRTISAGMPRALVRQARSRATRSSVSRRASRVEESVGTLASVRRIATDTSDRAAALDALFDVLDHVARTGGPTATVFDAIVDGDDPDCSDRLLRLCEWVELSGLALARDPQGLRRAWIRVRPIALASHYGSQRAAGLLAARLAATGVTYDIRTRPTSRSDDPRTPRVALAARNPLKGPTRQWASADNWDDWVGRAGDLAVLVAERTPLTLSDRPFFDVVSELIMRPVEATELAVDLSSYRSGKSIESIVEILRATRTENAPESDHRRAQVAELLLRIVEHMQSLGFGASDAAVDALDDFLTMVKSEFDLDRTVVTERLVDALRSSYKRAFLPTGRTTNRDAAMRSFVQMVTATIDGWVECTLALSDMNARRWDKTDDVADNGLAYFDPVTWGHIAVTTGIGRVFYPRLDQTAFERATFDEAESFSFPELEESDPLRGQPTQIDRPDVLLAVLHQRWIRAVAVDVRPDLQARRRNESHTAFLKSLSKKQRKAWSSRGGDMSAESFAPSPAEAARHLRARRLLRASAGRAPRADGVATATLAGWSEKALEWLETATGDADPSISAMLASVPVLPQSRTDIASYLERKDVPKPRGMTQAPWSTLYEFRYPYEMSGHTSEPKQDAHARRSHWFVRESKEWDRALILREEWDGSRRVVPLVDEEHRELEHSIPLSRRYAAPVLLESLLGDLLLCSMCWGSVAGDRWKKPVCPQCRGTGRIDDEIRGELVEGVWELLQIMSTKHKKDSAFEIEDDRLRSVLAHRLRPA